MPIITIANQKGGVGKTTSTMNLGVALARQKQRVLLIDSDPQANLSSYLGVNEPNHTLDEIYLAKRGSKPLNASEWIHKTESGVDVIPTDQALSGVEYYLFSRSDKETVLKKFLEPIVDQYDFIIIDTPPSLSLLTLNALVASDHILIPVQPDFFSLEGIVKIREFVSDIQGRWNPKLSILGVLPTQVNQRRKLTQEIFTVLQKEFGKSFFNAFIRENSAVTESSGHGQSVMDYQPSSNGAEDYLKAAKELIKRCQ